VVIIKIMINDIFFMFINGGKKYLNTISGNVNQSSLGKTFLKNTT
jgi:hypothetical protein